MSFGKIRRKVFFAVIESNPRYCILRLRPWFPACWGPPIARFLAVALAAQYPVSVNEADRREIKVGS